MRQNGTMDTMPSTSVNNSNMMVTNQIKMKRLLMCVLLSQLTQAESVAQPNIVLILADDMVLFFIPCFLFKLLLVLLLFFFKYKVSIKFKLIIFLIYVKSTGLW